MTSHTGALSADVIYTAIPTNPAFNARAAETPSNTLITDFGIASRTSSQPINDNQTARTGHDWPGFGFLDYFNHIHFSEQVIDLGNLLGEQVRVLRVFNAYSVDTTLTALTSANDEGLTVTQPGATPLDFKPLQELPYDIQVVTDGPPTIDATYTFEFDVGTFVVEVVGTRVIVWIWRPNWANPVTENLYWLTDVLTAYDGSEQTRQLRQGPRQGWQFSFDVTDRDRRILENTLYNWGSRVWALPVSPDAMDLAAPITIGDTTIALDTFGLDYHPNGVGVLLSLATGKYEAFEVDSVASDSVALKRPLLNSWAAGTRVYPARTARLQAQLQFGRVTDSWITGQAQFLGVDEVIREPSTETLYRDYPVLEIRTDWGDDGRAAYRRNLQSLDAGTGPVIVLDTSELAVIVNSLSVTLHGRAEIDAFKAFLFNRCGQAKAVWAPTNLSDLVLVGTVASTATNINVEYAALSSQVAAGVGRRDIKILLKDGTVFYRRVSGFVEIDDNTERLTLDSALGIDLSAAQVQAISWMSLCRLDSDEVDIEWESPQIATCSVDLRASRNSV